MSMDNGSGSNTRTAIVFMGGGARAAYQVGVLKGLVEINRTLHHEHRATPFTIVCGTSAGAINAATLAIYADDFAHAVARLEKVWRNFHTHQVYRSDWPSIAANAARWLGALTFGWATHRSPRALLDSRPLVDLLRHRLDFGRLTRMLQERHLHVLAVTALSYSSGRHVTFYQSDEPIAAWRRVQRSGRLVALSTEHLLASSAIPLAFQAIPLKIDGHTEYFGDGAVRQTAPLSPAVHFGASKILVIGAADAVRPEAPVGIEHEQRYPSLAQITQQVMAGVFQDAVCADIERVEHINQIVDQFSHTDLANGWRQIDVLPIAPSEPLERIAARHLRSLPSTIRTLFGAVGADRARGPAFASYLMFEAAYTRELIALGYRDALAQQDKLSHFLA